MSEPRPANSQSFQIKQKIRERIFDTLDSVGWMFYHLRCKRIGDALRTAAVYTILGKVVSNPYVKRKD